MNLQNNENVTVITQKVYQTDNYDMFHCIEGNRSINWKHVDELAELINRDGQQVNVLITPGFGIYDGQHRLEACRKLRIPVRFEITNQEKSIEDIQNLNISNNKWENKDFLESFAKRGSKPAERILSLMNEFHVSRVIALKAGGKDMHSFATYNTGVRKTKGKETVRSQPDPFKESTFSEQNYQTARDRLRFALEMVDILKKFRAASQRSKLIDLFVAIDKAEGFERKRLRDALEVSGDKLPVACSNSRAILEAVARIYNSHRRKNLMDFTFTSKGTLKKITCIATENRWM